MDTKKLRQKILDLAIHGKLVPPACRQAGKTPTMNPLPQPQQGKWFVYVLECEDGSFYKGFTEDLPRRWEQHCAGIGSEHTKAHKPLQVYYWEEHRSKDSAIQREKYLKSGVGREWFMREVVNNPEQWEPASVLLERIRKEKEQLIKEGKIKKCKKSTKTSACLPIGTDTPHYENAVPDGCQVPFEVPSGWVWTTVEDIATSNIGLTYKPTDICEDGVPVYRSNNIQNGRECLDDVVKVNCKILDSQYLHNGDLLICARNGSRRLVGKNMIIQNLKQKTSFGAFMAVCRSAYNPWIQILLNSTYFDHYLDDSNSTTINQITQKMLLAFQMPFPPMAEQARIVAEIERWFALVDIIEQSKDSLQATIAQAKSKILDLAIQGKLVPQDPSDEPAIELLRRINPKFTPCDNARYGQLPEGWATAKLGEIADYINGRAFKPEEWETYGMPIIRIQNLNDKQASFNHTTQKFEDKYFVRNGDLLFAWAASLGTYMWTGGDAWLNQHIFKVIPKECVHKEYLYWALTYLIADIYKQTHGSGMVHITRKKFELMTMPIPPLTEQKKITERVETLFSILDTIQSSIEAQ